jgi:SH3 domain protein
MTKSYLHQMLFVSLSALILLLSFSTWAATTVYVSDELTIPLRSGTSNSHRIIKFLPSGAKLNVIETNEDNSYTKVSAEGGKEGWVETTHIMKARSAREQLPGLQAKTKELRSIVKELKEKKSQLEQRIKKIDEDNQALADRIQELREVAAEPAAIADKNRRLTEQLEKVDAKNAVLEEDNERLSNVDIKLWFVVGGGVALLSVILGLIIPGFNWGRKKDSWGGSF